MASADGAGGDGATVDSEWKPPTFPHTLTMFDYFLGDRIKEGKGGNTALIDARTSARTTYAELHAAALTAGALFRECGVDIEQRVLLLLNNVTELPVVYFGAHAIGAVTTMAVPWLTDAALYEYFVTYTRARALVCPAALVALLRVVLPKLPYVRTVIVLRAEGEAEADMSPLGGVRFVDYGAEMARLAAAKAGEALVRPPDLCADDMALWYFTSGTTGLPKGCVHLQHDMPFAAETYGKLTMGLRESDVVATTSPMVGPYAMGSNLLFPMAVGAAAVMDAAQPMDAESTFALLAAHKPTVLSTTPGIIRSMAEHAAATTSTTSTAEGADATAATGAGMSSHLRYVTSAGDVLPAAVYRRWKEAFGVEVIDGIGTSELQHIFISNTLEPGGVRPGSVGRLVPGYTAVLLDDEGRVVPQGEVGELRVKADSNSLMYWNAHEKSKEVFAGDLYSTGDVAYVDEDGFYHLCGRKKDLKSMFSDKRRDIRISFLRVEDEMLGHPAVADCAVVDVAAGAGTDPVNTAYVVRSATHADGEPVALAAAIRAHLTAKVGAVNVPAAVEFVPRIPRNARDKIERKVLRDVLFTLFLQRDTDGNGYIDRDEFEAFVRDLKLKLPPPPPTPAGAPGAEASAVARLFDVYDKDSDGRLSFAEFREMLVELHVA